MYNSAVDYYKKQLVLAWQQNDTKNELIAYEQLSIQYYYLDIDPENIKKAMELSERVSRGLIEEDKSTLKQVWVNAQNKKDKYYEE